MSAGVKVVAYLVLAWCGLNVLLGAVNRSWPNIALGVILGGLVLWGLRRFTAGRVRCPHCRSEIPSVATVCRRCGRDVLV